MTLELSFIEQNIQYWTEMKAKHHSVKSVLIFEPSQIPVQKEIPKSLEEKIFESFKDIKFTTDNFPGYTWITRPRFNEAYPNIHLLSDGFYYNIICKRMKQYHPELPRGKTHNFPPFFYDELEKILQNSEYPLEYTVEKFRVRYKIEKFEYSKKEIESYIKDNLPLNEISSWDSDESSYSHVYDIINLRHPSLEDHAKWHISKVISTYWTDCLKRKSVKKNPSYGSRAKNVYPVILIKAVCEIFLSKRG